ncbi:MAG: hypothetical protein V8T87_14225 [Victivallales bacterium]
MNLYSNAIEDERVRRYLPVNRVMTGENFLGAEAVVNNPEVQLFLWGKTKPECTIQPGGWILVDFGIELHGGVRLLSREAGKIRLRFGEWPAKPCRNRIRIMLSMTRNCSCPGTE